MSSNERQRKTKASPRSKINSTTMYALGMIYAKGNIQFDRNKNCKLIFEIKYRKPSVSSERSDNISRNNVVQTNQNNDSVSQSVYNEFVKLRNNFKKEFDIPVELDLLPENRASWNKKSMTLVTESMSVNDSNLLELFDTDIIDKSTLQHVPNYLFDTSNTSLALVKSFLSGAADACGIPPDPNTSAFGTGDKNQPRLDLDISRDRWYVAVEICRLFQRRLGIPVSYINFGHPSVRGPWTHKQNHQLRIFLYFINETKYHSFNFSLEHKKKALEKMKAAAKKSDLDAPVNQHKFPDNPRGKKPKRVPLTINKYPFNDPDMPEELHNKHFGTFVLRYDENGDPLSSLKLTDDFGTVEKEKKLFTEPKPPKKSSKGIRSDAANLQIYTILMKKSYPIGPSYNYND